MNFLKIISLLTRTYYSLILIKKIKNQGGNTINYRLLFLRVFIPATINRNKGSSNLQRFFIFASIANSKVQF